MSTKNGEILASLRQGFLDAIEELSTNYKGSSLTDIFVTVDKTGGDTVFYDDEENIVARVNVHAWDEAECVEDDEIIHHLRHVVDQLEDEGQFESLDLYKPFSVNFADDEMLVIEELLQIHDDEIGQFDSSLLEKFDKDFDEFLNRLMNED